MIDDRRRVLPRVYATFTGPLSREAKITGALLYGGQQALLSHATAAEEWRMLTLDPLAPVHITVPYSCSAVSQPHHVVVHRSRAFPHLRVATDPARTSKADTVLDLATSEPDARAGMRRFVALATRGRVPVRELQRRLEERRPRRYGKALGDALRLLADGVQSALEQRYACDVELAHSLPTAQRQHPVVVDGRTLWEDVSYDLIGIPLTVRLDGRAFHDAPEVAFRDRRRGGLSPGCWAFQPGESGQSRSARRRAWSLPAAAASSATRWTSSTVRSGVAHRWSSSALITWFRW